MLLPKQYTHKGGPIYNITESEKNMEVLRENMRKQFDIFLDETENMDLLNLFSNSELKAQFVELFFNAIIKSEFEMFLGYKKYERTELNPIK